MERPFVFDDVGQGFRMRVLLDRIRESVGRTNVIKRDDIGMGEAHGGPGGGPESILNGGATPYSPIQLRDQHFSTENSINRNGTRDEVSFNDDFPGEVSVFEQVLRHLDPLR